jgi:hypothetical protein
MRLCSVHSPRERRGQWVKGLLASTLVLNLLDTILTLLVVMLGLAVEANPVMAAILERSPATFGVLKVALVSAGVLVLWQYRGRLLARVGSGVSFAAYALVALYHIQSVKAVAGLL